MSLSSKSTIAKNTILLYFRTIVLLFVSLYTSRVILNSLGVEDWGTYTAVAGVVTILNMVTGPLSGAISRFITFALGSGDKVELKKVFACSMTIQYIFVALVIVIIEIVGVWFLNSKMNIAPDRMKAANWVLQFALLTFAMDLIASPYISAIIAHEKMSAFAYFSIIDVILKLGVAYAIYNVGFDKLIAYSAMMAAVAVLIRIIYLIYCKRRFEECRKYGLTFDKKLFKNMFGFAGWSIFGGMASAFHIQGTNILLNIFGGSIVNAAQGIANQINNAIARFVQNFTTALTPSIIKSYAADNKDYMLTLIYQGARFSFYLLMFFAVPILIETEYIVHIWLGQCPPHTLNFIRLVIINALIDCLSKPIIAGVNATGKIRMYQIIVGGLLIMNLPVSYLALKQGAPVEATAIISIIISIIALGARLIISKKLIDLSVWIFVKKVLFVVSIVFIISMTPPLLLKFFMPKSIISFIVVIVVSAISCGACSFFMGCTKGEQKKILNKLFLVINRSNQ